MNIKWYNWSNITSPNMEKNIFDSQNEFGMWIIRIAISFKNIKIIRSIRFNRSIRFAQSISFQKRQLFTNPAPMGPQNSQKLPLDVALRQIFSSTDWYALIKFNCDLNIFLTKTNCEVKRWIHSQKRKN